MKQPSGYITKQGVGIKVLFRDPKLFDRVKKFADREKKGFSDAATWLIECGLRDVEESDRFEPKKTGT